VRRRGGRGGGGGGGGEPARRRAGRGRSVEEVPAPAAKDASPAKPSNNFEDESAVEADDPFGVGESSRDMPERSSDESAVQDELTTAEDEDTLGERAVQSEVEAVEGR